MSSHFVPAVGALQHLLLRFMHALLTQISQKAVCNRRHSIDQQVCRCLLMSLDRLFSDELTMTHEMLANTLGVRREGISESAYKSQSAGSWPTGDAVSRFSIASALNAYSPA
jgi:CRP-like cAMP-binding protein